MSFKFLQKGDYHTTKHVILRSFCAINLPKHNTTSALPSRVPIAKVYRACLMQLKGATMKQIARRYGCSEANIASKIARMDRLIARSFGYYKDDTPEERMLFKMRMGLYAAEQSGLIKTWRFGHVRYTNPPEVHVLTLPKMPPQVYEFIQSCLPPDHKLCIDNRNPWMTYWEKEYYRKQLEAE